MAYFIKKYKLQQIPLIVSPEVSETNSTNENLEISLTKLQLVDASKASWEQIFEFRKDEKAKANFRNLLLFFRTNYIGKPKTFIEDDINRRLEDYKNSVKDWGFDTKVTTISMILSSKKLMGTIGVTLTSALFNEPNIAKLSIGTGVTLELGDIILYLVKRKYGLSRLRRDNPLCYIIEAKRELE